MRRWPEFFVWVSCWAFTIGSIVAFAGFVFGLCVVLIAADLT